MGSHQQFLKRIRKPFLKNSFYDVYLCLLKESMQSRLNNNAVILTNLECSEPKYLKI